MRNKAGKHFVKSKERINCPVCGEILLMRSWRERKMTDVTGEKIKLMIRRMVCIKCRKIHHELPDCVVPYKRHSAETIEEILKGKEGIVCENRTIRRIVGWWKIVSWYFMNILKTLAEKYQVRFQPVPEFREIIRAAVNTNSWISAGEICTRSDFASG